ncbi:phage minor head protein [uncultured Methanobrevibacter sp.]|uniref:phage minor head protein n=2 Tax=uncultured Methanobrevibacter sp. TaxID=253161 RepID=UPI0025F9C80E|nr:phage minor head protein [uncultured Methanobrevibacter sp.]
MITTSSQDRILTNQLLLDELELWNLFDSKSIDDDQTQKYYQLIDDLLDSQIGESIAWLQSDAAEEYFFEQVSLQKEIFDALEKSWDDILENSYSSVDELLDNIYEVGKEKGYSNIRESLRYTDADKEAIRIAKDYNFHLLRKLDNDLRGTVKNKILQGIITGENPYNLSRTLTKAGVTKLDGSPFTARQRATMIAKTETSRMQNTGMLQSYVNEGYTQVKILTAEDKDVCTTCLEYAFKFNKDEPRVYSPGLLEREKVHDIVTLIKGGKFPPFHPLCRCTYLTVWKSKTEPPENPYVINLTPDNYLSDYVMKKFHDEFSDTNQTGVDDSKWNQDNIQNSLKSFVDKNDNLEMLSNNIFEFIQVAKSHANECVIASDRRFNVFGIIKGDDATSIKVPKEYIENVKNSYFGLTGHSHPVSKMPLPDLDDINYGLVTLNSKYNIIYAPEFGVMLIKKSEPNVKLNKKNLEDSYKKANDKRKDYVNDNIAWASDEYKKDNINNFNYFQMANDLDEIKDKVRHSNFKEQCEFFNEEFNQFGIEFIYISP